MNSEEIKELVVDALNDFCSQWIANGVPFSHHVIESGGTVEIQLWPRDVNKVVIFKQTSEYLIDSWRMIFKQVMVSGIVKCYEATIEAAREFKRNFPDMDDPRGYPLTPKDCLPPD